MLASKDVLREIAAHRTDQVVVTTMTSIFEWDDVVGEDNRHLPVLGCMGKASSVALGVAIARPDVRVICLDGDGSLLMNLGSLATIGGQAPKNLVHMVLQNNAYNITGGQPIPSAGKVDFSALALAASFKHAATFEDLQGLKAALPGLLTREGPTFVTIKVAPSGPQPKLQHGRMTRTIAAVRDAIK